MTKQKHFYLVRGLIREARHWGDFPQYLLNEFPGCKISYLEIPGAGILNQKISPTSIKSIVESMRKTFIKSQTDEEAILVAISLGGMIACEWIKNHPQDFDRLILINTSFGDLSPIYHRLKLPAFIYLLKIPFIKGKEKEKYILHLVKNHKNDFNQVLFLWEKIQSERPVSFKNSMRQLWAAANFKLGQFNPQLPVLVLASTQDRMVDVKCSRKIANKWALPIIEHPTAGHDLSADDPRWIAEKIKNFMT
ncbi:MAG: alpha/beta fold hydrolase [Bacteriovoracaceae bacterium]